MAIDPDVALQSLKDQAEIVANAASSESLNNARTEELKKARIQEAAAITKAINDARGAITRLNAELGASETRWASAKARYAADKAAVDAALGDGLKESEFDALRKKVATQLATKFANVTEDTDPDGLGDLVIRAYYATTKSKLEARDESKGDMKVARDNLDAAKDALDAARAALAKWDLEADKLGAAAKARVNEAKVAVADVSAAVAAEEEIVALRRYLEARAARAVLADPAQTKTGDVLDAERVGLRDAVTDAVKAWVGALNAYLEAFRTATEAFAEGTARLRARSEAVDGELEVKVAALP